jgi:hypothetical protein
MLNYDAIKMYGGGGGAWKYKLKNYESQLDMETTDQLHCIPGERTFVTCSAGEEWVLPRTGVDTGGEKYPRPWKELNSGLHFSPFQFTDWTIQKNVKKKIRDITDRLFAIPET